MSIGKIELKVEKPIDEKKMPPAAKSGHFKHLEIYQAAVSLPEGKVLPVVCESEERAKKFASGVQHTAFAEFRAFVRGTTVFIRLRNEEDEKQREHILKLRQAAKDRKAGKTA